MSIDPARIRDTEHVDERGHRYKTAGNVDGVLVGTAFWEERVRLKDVERELAELRNEMYGYREEA